MLESQHQTLAVVRSLSRAGFRVVLGATGRRHEARWSRHVSEVWLHDPLTDIQSFCDSVNLFLGSRPDVVAIFPVAERCRRLLIDHNLSFDRPIVGVPDDLFVICRDKMRANDLALAAGLHVPESATCRSTSELMSCADQLGYPVIVKPYGSATSLFEGKAFIAQSEKVLQERFSEWPSDHQILLIQQYVQGAVHGADFVARDGQLIGYCEATTERTDALDGTGFGVVFRSQAPTQDLFEATKKFVATSKYSGPGLIQFIRDQKHQLHFLENNPRLSAGVASSVQWGQDMPVFALEATCPELFDPLSQEFSPNPAPYECGTDILWFTRELRAYLNKAADMDSAAKKTWCSQVWRSLRTAKHHVVWQWQDPLPALYLIARLLVTWLRRR